MKQRPLMCLTLHNKEFLVESHAEFVIFFCEFALWLSAGFNGHGNFNANRTYFNMNRGKFGTSSGYTDSGLRFAQWWVVFENRESQANTNVRH